MAFELLGKAVRCFRLPVVDYSNASIKIIYAQSGDVKTRYFEITLYDDRGDVDLSRYAKATLTGQTPDGKTLSSNQCEISPDGKKVTVQFSGGFTALAGRVACDITFTNDEATEQLTSQTFYVIVSQSQTGNEISENNEDYNQLLSLLQEVGQLEARIEEAESGRVTAEQGRVLAEETREANFATTKETCETATNRANEAAETVEEILATLPCNTVIEREGQFEDIVALRFVELKGE